MRVFHGADLVPQHPDQGLSYERSAFLLVCCDACRVLPDVHGAVGGEERPGLGPCPPHGVFTAASCFGGP